MAVNLQSTKFSDIDLAFAKQYLRIEPDFTDDDFEVQLMLDVAKDFVFRETQMTQDDLDLDRRANILYLKVLSEMYHNRSVTVDYKVVMDPLFKMMVANMRNPLL